MGPIFSARTRAGTEFCTGCEPVVVQWHNRNDDLYFAVKSNKLGKESKEDAKGEKVTQD